MAKFKIKIGNNFEKDDTLLPHVQGEINGSLKVKNLKPKKKSPKLKFGDGDNLSVWTTQGMIEKDKPPPNRIDCSLTFKLTMIDNSQDFNRFPFILSMDKTGKKVWTLENILRFVDVKTIPQNVNVNVGDDKQ